MASLVKNASHLVSGPAEESPLAPAMEIVDPALAKAFNERVDLLRSYISLAENPADLADENYKRMIFAKLSYGLRKCGEHLSWARFNLRVAHIEVKKAEAVAAVDGIHEFVATERDKGRDGKITDKVREHYKYIDKDVGSTMMKEAMLEAMVEQLSVMKTEFIMAIATIRAMAYGIKDQDFISSASTSVNEKE